ncbi:hypothetical protein IQ273_30030 [Nodosilinea sp. LEGE 07298]|uniref:Calx-beta domain-containing protein n=1 Tax=Nodosilinea sp. LEGE 07298 TaxID=2777970 RepID=UPI001882EA63|nr:putative Ig domain-containing protein [Nodosilinea sp. LEGE 07298]MBE9113616.1 hypothetical protein [Nodosilinea sp. LEGE 07298]
MADQLSSGVSQIFSAQDAFAALKEDGSVVTWGRSDRGGDSSTIADQLSSGVTQIFSTIGGASGAFAALKENGSVITWGDPFWGGDSSAVADQLSSGVSQIFSVQSAFAALKEDGSVVTWGRSESGGDSSAVADQLSSGVSQIFATGRAFAALKEDGSVVTWGRSAWGGDSSAVTDQLSSGVVTLASPFLKYNFTPAGGSGSGNSEPGDGALVPVSPPSTVSLDHAFLEVLAKDLVYKDWVNNSESLENTLNESDYNINGYQYRLDSQAGINNGVWGHNEGLGLYAIGLISDDDGAPPILALRGTGGPTDAVDWIDNIDPRGVGFPQFDAYRIAIDQWLNSLGDRGYSPAYITGHSLGGALAQWFGSYYTDFRAKPLSGVVTFNSPGINGTVQHNGQFFGADTLESGLVNDITHYIATGDVISLFGRKFLDGNVKKFSRSDNWAYNPLSPHLDPILVQDLPENGSSKPNGSFRDLTSQQLSSNSFNYYGYGSSSLQYASLQILVGMIPGFGPPLADAMKTRGNANLNLDVFRGLANLSVEIGNLGVAALEAAQEAVVSIGNGGAAALESIQNWGIDAWEAASNMTADAWRNAQTWTASTWQSTVGFTANQWDALTGTLNNAVNSTVNFISSTVSNIFNTSVTVSLAQPSDTEVAISYQSVDGTAITNQDYAAVSGTLVFAPGETEKKIPIQLLNVGSIDEAKMFEVQLSNPQNINLVLGNSILVNIKPNQAPTLQNQISSQTTFVNQNFFFSIPKDTFADADLQAGDQLRYEVSLADGSPLPGWLTFDSLNGFLVGTPSPIDLDNLTLNVTVTDQAKRSVSTEFRLDVSVSQDDIVGPAAINTATRFTGNSDNNIFRGSSAADIFDLTAGGANIVKGTIEQLDGDKIIGFDPNDVLLFKDIPFSPSQLNISFDSGLTTLSVVNLANDDGQIAGKVILEGSYDVDQFVVSSLDGFTKVTYSDDPSDTSDPSELFTPIQTIGDLTLGATQLGYAIQFSDGTLLPVTNNGAVATPVDGWQALAVNQGANGVGFTLYWRNGVTQQTATWSLNAQGAFTSSALMTPAQGLFAETNLNVDLTGDGQIGLAFIPIQTVGDLTLGSTQLGYAIQFGDGTLLPVTNNGEMAAPIDGWQALAVDQAAVGGGFTLYWRNTVTQQTATWSLDAQGALVLSALLTPAQALFAETNLNVDLTGDSQIGLTFTPIQAVGDLTLGSMQLGYAIQGGDGVLLPVTINGAGATPVDGWQALAVEPGAGGVGFTLYWRNAATQQTATWSLNAQGAFTSSALLTPAQALFAETNLNVDLTGDGEIGLAFTPIQAVGDLTLGSTQLGYAIQAGDGPLLPVTINGAGATPVDGWQALAVDQGAGGVGFTLYWRNGATQQTATWSLNAQGAFTSSALLTPAQALFAETNLNVDLTGDSQIGLTFTPIQAVGDLTLGSTQLGYAIQLGDGALLPVTINGEVATPVDGWQALAVDQADSQGFTLYWRNTATQQLATWSLNAQCAFVASAPLLSALALFAETNLNVDLTGDSEIGLAFSPIQTVDNLTLGSTLLGYAIQTGDGTLLPVNRSIEGMTPHLSPIVGPSDFPTSPVVNNGEVATRPVGWQALAVDHAADGAGFTLYWRNAETQQFLASSLNAQGTLLSTKSLTPAEVLLAEASLSLDLVGDGKIIKCQVHRGDATARLADCRV